MGSLAGGWVIVFVTASSVEEAKAIAREVVRDKLVACVNIVDKIHSIYWWMGRVEESSESLLVMKTRIELLDKLVKKIKSLHSYQVPEIIAVPIIAGYKEYLDWIKESTS